MLIDEAVLPWQLGAVQSASGSLVHRLRSFPAGAWTLSGSPELQWTPGHRWHLALQLPAGAVSEYKYVLLDGNGHAMSWQRGNNSVLAIRAVSMQGLRGHQASCTGAARLLHACWHLHSRMLISS